MISQVFTQRMRKIIHIDMDAFYASVEQNDDSDLRGKPRRRGGGIKRVVSLRQRVMKLGDLG